MKKYVKILLLFAAFSGAIASRLAPAVAQSPASPPTADQGGDDVLIVANLKAPVDKIDITELKAIYLKKKLYWSMGEDALPLNSQYGSRLREEFQARVLGMAPEVELKYWERQKIEHAILPPPEFPQPQKAVFKLRNSVSYVFRRDFSPNVTKILLVIPSNPSQSKF
jgi:ABC-type phosphate transport system substrate-binding protein